MFGDSILIQLISRSILMFLADCFGVSELSKFFEADLKEDPPAQVSPWLAPAVTFWLKPIQHPSRGSDTSTHSGGCDDTSGGNCERL